MSSFAWLLILVPVWMLLSSFFCDREGRRSASRGPHDSRRDEYERSLVAALMGDRLQAEQLIVREFRRNPGLSRAEAAREAFDRLNRDRDDAMEPSPVVQPAPAGENLMS